MRARTWILVVSAAAVIAVLGAVGLAPIASGSHEQVFEIPHGIWARRMAGDKVETLPDHIYLTVGVRDILGEVLIAHLAARSSVHKVDMARHQLIESCCRAGVDVQPQELRIFHRLSQLHYKWTLRDKTEQFFIRK